MSKKSSKAAGNNKRGADGDEDLDALLREVALMDKANPTAASSELSPPSLRLEPFEPVPTRDSSSFGMAALLTRYISLEPRLWSDFIRLIRSDLSTSPSNRDQLVRVVQEMRRKVVPEMAIVLEAIDGMLQNAMGQFRNFERSKQKTPCPATFIQNLEELVGRNAVLLAKMDYSLHDTIEKELRKLHTFALPTSFHETICKAYFQIGILNSIITCPSIDCVC